MKTYIEDFLNCAVGLVKEKINDKLTEIDNERNDFELKKIDLDNGIIFQSMNNFPVNFDPILYYGADNVTQIGEVESASGESWEIEFSIVLSDPQDRTVTNRIFRYQRALKEIFLENYIKMNNMRTKVRVRSLNPVAFTLQNSSNEYRAIGIIIETTLFN